MRSNPSIIDMLLQTAITRGVFPDSGDRRDNLYTHIHCSVPVVFPNTEGVESGWRTVWFFHAVLPYYAVHLSVIGGWYDTGHVSPAFEGGKYAVYHYKGFPQFLSMVYQEVFCRWLSKTGNQLDNRPIFDIYRNIREDGYMEIDICFPLK